MSIFFGTPKPSSAATRPGSVKEIKGIIFQNDQRSTIGHWIIRPFEMIDRRIAGLRNSDPLPHAMHAGLHVVLEDGREYVAEQLVGGAYLTFVSGVCWTPIEEFRTRDRGGWDVTIPATTIRGIDEADVQAAVQRLNTIDGAPFWKEDCTGFIERAFGTTQLFADSPTLRSFGIRGHLGDPALPLIRRDAKLDPRAEQLLHADILRTLPDSGQGSETHRARIWTGRAMAGVAVVAGLFFTRRLWANAL